MVHDSTVYGLCLYQFTYLKRIRVIQKDYIYMVVLCEKNMHEYTKKKKNVLKTLSLKLITLHLIDLYRIDKFLRLHP